MDTDINLLLRRDEESIKRHQKVKILRFIAVISLLGVGTISLVIFLLTQAINPPSVKKEQDDLLRKISQLQNRQAKLFVLNDRISNISEILQRRKDLSQTAAKFLAKTPSNLSIENLEVDDKSIVMTGFSPSLLAIGELINNLTDMVRKKEIASLTLNALVFDASKSNYQFSIKSEL